MNQPEIKRTLLECSALAGDLMKTSFGSGQKFTKKSELSIVTDTDVACEKLIIDHILKQFPDHSILAEESHGVEGSSSRWIIDPIDGTTNFAHGYPVSCVSIAYEEEGEILMGGIFDPFREEQFFAQKGSGAFLNNQKISVSKTSELGSALLGTGFPYDRRENADLYLEVLKAFLMTGQGLRRTGSAAIDMCYVACGRFDAYWEFGLEPWDKAAAMLIASEAGGVLTDFAGNPLTLEAKQNLVTNGLIHEAMLNVLEPFKGFKALAV